MVFESLFRATYAVPIWPAYMSPTGSYARGSIASLAHPTSQLSPACPTAVLGARCCLWLYWFEAPQT